MKDKILITGSNGLIGSALKEALLKFGIDAKGIDNSYAVNHVDYGDIRDTDLLGKVSLECVGIVHLAGISRVITGEKEPELCWQLNVDATQKILEIAKNLPNKPWIIYSSSREVYGQQDHLPVKENAALLPINIYARSKLTAEQLVLEYRKQGLQTAILRFSNVYGSSNDHHDRVIPAFCKTAAMGGTIRIDGEHNVFDFTYIDDVINGIIKVIDKLQRGCSDLPNMHFVSGQGTTLLQAAKLAKSISDKPINLLTASSRCFDVGSFYGDPGLAERVLNWKATVPLQAGIAQLVQKFKAQML